MTKETLIKFYFVAFIPMILGKKRWVLAALFFVAILIVVVYISVGYSEARNDFLCGNDKGILANESQGQLELDNLVLELKQEIAGLEKENPNLTLEDKINYTNNKTFYYIKWIDADTVQVKTECYAEFDTKNTTEWNPSHHCLRRTRLPSVGFIALQKCGACEEYAKLNSYLLNSIRIKTRVVATMSMDHMWNEVFIDGQWVQDDATSSNFFFNDTKYYKENNIDLYWVKVIEGEGKGEDLTYKYNPHPSWIEHTERVLNKPFFQIKDFFLERIRNR